MAETSCTYLAARNCHDYLLLLLFSYLFLSSHRHPLGSFFVIPAVLVPPFPWTTKKSYIVSYHVILEKILTCVLVFLLANIFSIFFPISSISSSLSSSELSPSSVLSTSALARTLFCRSNMRWHSSLYLQVFKHILAH